MLLEEVDDVLGTKMDKVNEKIAKPFAIMKKYEGKRANYYSSFMTH